MFENNNDRSQYEYHYNYQPDSSAPQPAPAPVPWEPQKPKGGKAKKIVAGVLCGALLVGGSFGVGWMAKGGAFSGKDETQVMVSNRQPVEVQTVAVTGNEKLSFAQIYEANVDSCVSINSSAMATVGYNIFGQQVQREAVSSGSGFILTADGYIATNCHVVNNAINVQVTLNDGTTYDATVVGSDSDYDIAVLKVDPGETKLKPVVLGTSSGLNVGEEVSTIGNPLGELTFSLTHGIVSCLDREINLDGTPFNMIQVDTAINPGNSGGPLFNAYGEVVGIVTAKTSSDGNGNAAEGLGFAIPIDDVLSMLKDIMENGQVTTHAYVGITMDSASRHPEAGVASGAYLVTVNKDSPAEKAGLQAGDVVTMLGTTTITSSDDLKSAVGSKSYQAGDTATVTYVREGKVYTTELTFGSTTEAPEDPEPQASVQQDQKQPEQGYSDDYYGDMEDFFNQFFGRYGRAS